MKKMVLFILINSLLLLGGCIEPPQPPYQPPQDNQVSETETDIQALLLFNGIESVVQINDSEIVVRYNQPEVLSENDAFLHIGLILGTVCSFCSETDIIRLQPFIEDVPLIEIIIYAEKFFAYRNCDITIDEFVKSWDLQDMVLE